jgi:hypothetical protein
MTAQAVIDQFKALRPKQRAEVAKFIVESDDSWIPDSFKRGMADAVAGHFADMDAVLNEAPPPSRRRSQTTNFSGFETLPKAAKVTA